ncbi:MAG TPA: Ig-like domain-containing protein [Desulfuromonadales bacterium]|nr:Ig-like domain-containing protein [Desulfuromonadales bacterium]
MKKSRSAVSRMLLVALFVLVVAAGNVLASEMFFESFNAAGVDNGPTVDTIFTLTKPTAISSIVNYHWNYSQGQDPNLVAGWIGIEQIVAGAANVEMGKWPAVGRVGAYGMTNVLWVATANVLLGPGTYKVTDSNPETWSYAAYSYAPYGWPDGANWEINKGFSQIFSAASATATVPANGATAVSTRQPLTVNFSENVVQGPAWDKITATYLNYSGTKPVVTTIPLSKSLRNNVLKLTPKTPFKGHALITVTIPAGSVVDLGGTSSSGALDPAPSKAYQYTFTTAP